MFWNQAELKEVKAELKAELKEVVDKAPTNPWFGTWNILGMTGSALVLGAYFFMMSMGVKSIRRGDSGRGTLAACGNIV